MAKGARIGYWRGSIAGLIDDIQACCHSSVRSCPTLHAARVCLSCPEFLC